MTPEYLYELADLADPDQLWRLSGADQMQLDDAQKKQLHTGVALRRYAHDIQELLDAYRVGKSILLTRLGTSRRAVMRVETPENHKKLLRG